MRVTLCEIGTEFSNSSGADTADTCQLAVTNAVQMLVCAHTGAKQGLGNGDIHSCGTYAGKEVLNGLPVRSEVRRSL